MNPVYDPVTPLLPLMPFFLVSSSPPERILQHVGMNGTDLPAYEYFFPLNDAYLADHAADQCTEPRRSGT